MSDEAFCAAVNSAGFSWVLYKWQGYFSLTFMDLPPPKGCEFTWGMRLGRRETDPDPDVSPASMAMNKAC